MIYGICGLYQAGKDTIADYLVKAYGFKKVSFSDQLKFIATKYLGWDGQKDENGRTLLQQLGTEIGRDKISENFWIDKGRDTVKILNLMGYPNIVFCDARFLNELAFVDRSILVSRNIPRDAQVLQHRSEQMAQSDYIKGMVNYILENDGSFEELYNDLDVVMEREGIKKI